MGAIPSRSCPTEGPPPSPPSPNGVDCVGPRVSSVGTHTRDRSPHTGHPTGAGPSLTGGADGEACGGVKAQALWRWPGSGTLGGGLGIQGCGSCRSRGTPDPAYSTPCPTLPFLIRCPARGTRGCRSAAHSPRPASGNRLVSPVPPRTRVPHPSDAEGHAAASGGQ